MNDQLRIYEEALLSAMLGFRECIPKVEKTMISHEDFDDEILKKGFQTIMQHHHNGLPIELPALAATLGKKGKTVIDAMVALFDCATTGETATYYARQIVTASQNRQIAVLGAELQRHPEKFTEIIPQLQFLHQVPATSRRLLFESASDFLTNEIKIDYLIHKLFEINALASITGPSGQYKSFVAVCMACSIVTGKSWCNRAVKQGSVLYLAGEGRNGIKRRVAAWRIAHGVTPEEMAGFYLSHHTLMMDGSNIDEIVAEMEGVDVVMVVVDTLARHKPG